MEVNSDLFLLSDRYLWLYPVASDHHKAIDTCGNGKCRDSVRFSVHRNDDRAIPVRNPVRPEHESKTVHRVAVTGFCALFAVIRSILKSDLGILCLSGWMRIFPAGRIRRFLGHPSGSLFGQCCRGSAGRNQRTREPGRFPRSVYRGLADCFLQPRSRNIRVDSIPGDRISPDTFLAGSDYW